MDRIFGFATGNLWTSKDMNRLLESIMEIGVSGVELTFGTKGELYSFRLSNKNRSWLRKLEYVSVHAPFRLVAESDGEEEVARQLDIIQGLYDDVDARNVVIHPDNLPEPEILESYDFFVSTENLEKRRHVAIDDLKRIFRSYPKLGFCLDTSHAYTCSKEEATLLIRAFKNRISQVHFSGTYRNRRHQSLAHVTKDFLSSIQPVKKLDVPIVIEGGSRFTKGMQTVRKEVEQFKSFFKT